MNFSGLRIDVMHLKAIFQFNMNFILKALIHGILADVPIGGNFFRLWSEEKKILDKSKWIFKKQVIFIGFLKLNF